MNLRGFWECFRGRHVWSEWRERLTGGDGLRFFYQKRNCTRCWLKHEYADAEGRRIYTSFVKMLEGETR